MAKQIRHSDAIPEQRKQDRRVGKKTREKHNNKLYDVRVEKNISQRKLAELSGLVLQVIIMIATVVFLVLSIIFGIQLYKGTKKRRSERESSEEFE